MCYITFYILGVLYLSISTFPSTFSFNSPSYLGNSISSSFCYISYYLFKDSISSFNFYSYRFDSLPMKKSSILSLFLKRLLTFCKYFLNSKFSLASLSNILISLSKFKSYIERKWFFISYSSSFEYYFIFN